MQLLFRYLCLVLHTPYKMKNMKNWLLLIMSGMFLFSSGLFAQQMNLVQPTMTPRQAVEDVLLGAGINAFNITYNGSGAAANQVQQSVKRFNNTDPAFPISGGVLMHTSGAPSTLGDPDLAAIGGNITNGTIIEFDFVPSGDTLSFNYIFSSAEYTSFTCSNYNDVFGFFISGPGINGPYSNNSVNIATVPGSNNIPVGINTVNAGTNADTQGNCFNADPNWQANAIYFTTSYNPVYTSAGAPMNEYNGSTISLSANSDLSCGDTFHIKLAISNVSDQSLNSGVFLEANSFSSAIVDINIETNKPYSDSLLIEGCMEASVYFTRPANQLGSLLSVDFTVSGTATEGVDYPALNGGVTTIVFQPTEDSIEITISPVLDGIIEGPESIIISAQTVTPCGDTIYATGTIWIDDAPISTVTASDTTILCANDSVPIWATTQNGFPPYTYEWSNGQSGQNAFGSALTNGPTSYVVTSIDECGFEFTDTTTIILNQTLKIDSLVQMPADCGEENGAVIGYGHVPGYTGTPQFKWTGPGANTAFTNASVWGNKPSGWYYFTIKDAVCSVTDSIFLEETPPPTAAFDANPESGFAPLDVTFTNNSDPATTYYWDFGNGQTNVVNNLSDQNTTYFTEGVYTVTLVTETGSCTDQATKVITVTIPLGYELPNVFTPNGDGQNDLFTINAINAKSLEIVILNRWGNVVFESTDVDFAWNGKINNSGAECKDGTYFYKFVIVDYSGNETEEHGFVQLVNDK